MTQTDRERLIETYFDALDEEDPTIVEPSLSADFVFGTTAGELTGPDAVATYMTDLRSSTNTTHTPTRFVHGDGVTVAEGTVTGEGADGAFEAAFNNVFEFDDADETLTAIRVYLNKS